MASGKPTLVLASASPRRRELLDRLGLPFVVRPTYTDEELQRGEPPAESARRLALLKARAAARGDGEWIIAADTLVELNGKILAKPKDARENELFLRALSGKTHNVHTGLAVVSPQRSRSLVSTAQVSFRDLADWEIAAYAASGEGLDKAGGYGIQEKGMMLVYGVNGDFYTVMGLPVAMLWQTLAAMGYPLAEAWSA